jgi:hypothetical protein
MSLVIRSSNRLRATPSPVLAVAAALGVVPFAGPPCEPRRRRRRASSPPSSLDQTAGQATWLAFRQPLYVTVDDPWGHGNSRSGRLRCARH